MPVKFVPPPRSIVLCDYGQGGFVEPEMVKRRPAIVVSPRLPHRDNLCAVVPLSTTAPDRPAPYVVSLILEPPLPEPFAARLCWAKCDLIATVALGRLDLFRTGRDHTGKRRYLTTRLPEADFERVRVGILAGLGMRSG